MFYNAAMQQHPEILEQIREGEFGTLREWMTRHIYQHGSKFTAEELIERITGGPIQNFTLYSISQEEILCAVSDLTTGNPMDQIIKGFRIAYTEEGKGHTVLFVHGYPLSRRIWDPQVHALSSNYRVIAPDLPGHGNSEPVSGPIFDGFLCRCIERSVGFDGHP